jgi:hypothetical protein
VPLSVANENRLHKTVAQCLTPSWPAKMMQELPSGDCWQFTGAGICSGRRAGSSRRDGVSLANTVERREFAAPRVYVFKKRRVARDKAGQATNKFEVYMFWRRLLPCVANGEADIDPFSACDLREFPPKNYGRYRDAPCMQARVAARQAPCEKPSTPSNGPFSLKTVDRYERVSSNLPHVISPVVSCCENIYHVRPSPIRSWLSRNGARAYSNSTRSFTEERKPPVLDRKLSAS